MDTKLSIEDLLRLSNLFENNNWGDKGGQDVVFDIMVEMLSSFSEEQKVLLFELFERYLWISLPEYTEFLLKTLDKIEPTRLENIQRVLLFPIIKLKDISKVKSSVVLLYNFRQAHFGGLKFRGIEFKMLETLKAFEDQIFTENDLLFLVDDFIGTGGTLEETLDFASQNKTLALNQINVISLVTQEETANKIRDRNIHFQTCFEVKKGISSYYSGEDYTRKKAIMQKLENMIPKIKEYKFGYKQSEALVTMNRTPNNTFPIFWKTHRRAGKYIKPPFPRFYEQ